MFSKRQLLKGGLWLIGILILALLPFIIRNAYHLQVLIMLFWYAYLAICWNWVGGFAGQFSMIHGTFVGVGGYTSTLLFLNFGLTPFIGMVLGGVLAALLSIIVSYPCFRLRGIYFALSTMAFGLSIQILFMNTYSVWGIKINGADGLSILPRDSFVLFQSTSKVPYYLVILALLVGVLALSAGIRHSKLGYYLTAINENQESAESLGINSSRYKLMAFMISAFFSAIGGTFYAQLMLIIDPGRIMGIDFSIELGLMSILGGMQSIWGPLLGASIIVPTSEYLRAFLGSKYAGSHLAIYGLMLMVMVIYFPRGLSEFINIGIARIRTALGKSEPVI